MSKSDIPLTPQEAAFIDGVLEEIQRTLAFVGGCTLTDQPDQPLTPETSWTMNFRLKLMNIRTARALLRPEDGTESVPTMQQPKTPPFQAKRVLHTGNTL